jgi:hypothetical protein
MRLSIFNFKRLKGLGRIPLKAWLWMVLIAISAVLVYIRCVGMITHYYGRGENSLTMAVEELSAETKIISLCSSHGFAAINPSYMDAPLVNLSMNSGNYEALEIILLSHLEKVPNLKYALIELDNTCLALDRLSGTRDFRELYDLGADPALFPRSAMWKFNQRILDHHLVKPVVFYKRITPYELVYLRKAFYTPEQLAEMGAIHVVPEDPIPANRDNPGKPVPGHGEQLKRMDKEMLDEIQKIQLNPDIVTQSRYEANAAAFTRMLDVLDKHDIQPVFIRFPYTYAYNRWSTPAWKEIASKHEAEVRTRYAEKFVLWDFTHKPEFKFDEFADSQHLNKWGAIRFSQVLDTYILGLPDLNLSP